jgi:hypothetical protein
MTTTLTMNRNSRNFGFALLVLGAAAVMAIMGAEPAFAEVSQVAATQSHLVDVARLTLLAGVLKAAVGLLRA